MFDNESAYISSPAKGAGPCCHRSPCDLHDKAANKPCTAATAAYSQNAALSQHIPKNYGAGGSKGQKSPGLQRQICMLRSHGEDNHRPQTCSRFKAWSTSENKITPIQALGRTHEVSHGLFPENTSAHSGDVVREREFQRLQTDK